MDYSEAYQKLSIPACIVSCDNTGVMQLAVMRQTDYRARIAQAAFGARWDSKDDGIPEADGHVDGNPLVIAVDMDLRRLIGCTAAVRQGRKEIMVAALRVRCPACCSILPKNARSDPYASTPRSSPWPLAGTVRPEIPGRTPSDPERRLRPCLGSQKAGEAGRPHCRTLGKKAGPVSKQA
ncbi:MAG: hypothetical protein ACLVGA_16040 [Dysosmobacter sp.]